MKISLTIGSTYQIRLYYVDSECNKSKYIDWNELVMNEINILLLDTIKNSFNVIKNTNDSYSDITEIDININAWWNFELWVFQEILETNPTININKIWGQEIQEFIVKNSEHNLSFKWWVFLKLVLENIKIDSLLFSEVTIITSILFKKIKEIWNLTFDSCSGTSASDKKTRLEFEECKKIKQLNLVRTSFWYIAIVDSEINNVFPYKIHFDKVEYIGNKNSFNNILKKYGELINSLTEIKDYYRQLKHSHDEIWNKTEANKFFAKEMFYHRKNLWLDKDYGAWFVSLLQLVSNNYGAFWWLPLLWIVGISFIYTLLVNCPNFSCVCWDIQDWNCFSTYWLKNVSQFPTELKNASNWWFFFYSIMMGSLIYQFLIALRRISQR